MKKSRDKAEICKVRKESGLTCGGCQYHEECEAEKSEGLPEGIKSGTKQAKIYGLLKSGKTTKEIIQSKEFASESVYIVARRYFPDSLDKTKSKPRKKEQLETPENPNKVAKSFEELMKKNQEITNVIIDLSEGTFDGIEPAPEIDERILNLEKIIKDEEKRRIQRGEVRGELKYAKKMLEDGEIVKCYAAIKKALELMEEDYADNTL